MTVFQHLTMCFLAWLLQKWSYSERFLFFKHVYKLTQISKDKRMLWTISYSQKTWCKPQWSGRMKRLYQRKWRRNRYDSYCTNWTFAQSLTRHQHSIIPKSLWESRWTKQRSSKTKTHSVIEFLPLDLLLEIINPWFGNLLDLVHLMQQNQFHISNQDPVNT